MAYRQMPSHPKAPVALPITSEEEIAHLITLPEVHQATDWLRSAEPKLQRWQMELARIPAPPFGEAARSEWLAQRFRELGLDEVQIDEAGNVFGIHPGADRRELDHRDADQRDFGRAEE